MGKSYSMGYICGDVPVGMNSDAVPVEYLESFPSGGGVGGYDPGMSK